jgi:hypothetical protein
MINVLGVSNRRPLKKIGFETKTSPVFLIVRNLGINKSWYRMTC